MITTPTGFEVSSCLKAMGAIEQDLRKLTADLTECQFQAPPRTGGWSIAFCIEHLTLAGNALIVRWDAAVAGRKPSPHGETRPVPYSWLGRAILRFIEPPYRVKISTGRLFVPRVRRPMQETLRCFLKMHRDLAQRVAASEGLPLDRIKIESPCLSWVKYPLRMSVDVALAHERRHLWQAWQVRRKQGQEECP